MLVCDYKNIRSGLDRIGIICFDHRNCLGLGNPGLFHSLVMSTTNLPRTLNFCTDFRTLFFHILKIVQSQSSRGLKRDLEDHRPHDFASQHVSLGYKVAVSLSFQDLLGYFGNRVFGHIQGSCVHGLRIVSCGLF